MKNTTHTLPWIALLCFAGWSCKGEVQRVGDDAQIPVEVDAGPRDLLIDDDAPPTAGDITLYDATTNPGDPCTFSFCAGEMICMANVCRTRCTQTVCHEKPTECAADERCVWASDFSGACLPATNIYRENCDQQDWLNCTEGTLCIRVSGMPAKCILVCEDNSDCPTGIACTALNPPNEMCKVCPE